MPLDVAQAFAREVRFPADARLGELTSCEVTLSGTPGNVTSINLPDSAIGFRLYPRLNAVRFAVGENTEAVGASATTPVLTTDFKKGGVAKADQWETRLLVKNAGPGTARTLRLSSATASVAVDVEVF